MSSPGKIEYKWVIKRGKKYYTNTSTPTHTTRLDKAWLFDNKGFACSTIDLGVDSEIPYGAEKAVKVKIIPQQIVEC
jgi:hypothetical protein